MRKLTDPGELDIIREVYFDNHQSKSREVDEDELLDRKLRKHTVNQAR